MCMFYSTILQVYNQKIEFAPIGLIDMYNSGGAVEAVEFSKDSASFGTIILKGRGAGPLGAYSNSKPMFCTINSKEEEVKFDIRQNLLLVTIPSGTNNWEIRLSY